MKIAMLGHKRIPSREGGIEIVVEELASSMVARGHNVTCYNRRGHHISGASFDGEKLKEYKGVRLKNVWTIKRRGLAAVTASFFASICAAFGRYDVVHFHAEGPCFMLWLPKLFGKRCIATIHGLDHKRAKWGRFASWYIRTGERCAVKYADEIIVLSESVKQYFADKYGRSTVLIPNGVTRPELKEAKEITERFGLVKDGYILFLGRIVPEKGVRYLIEAYKKSNCNIKLVISGGASDTDGFFNEMKELAKDDERILFTGFVQGRLLEELYSNAYVYVLPSDLEGMPLSLLEAMSYGNCCLTSDIPECADVIGQHGVVFPKGNVDALCKKLEQLCALPEAVNEFKRNASDFICSKYNWSDVVDKTLKLYGAELNGDVAEEKRNEDIAYQ